MAQRSYRFDEDYLYDYNSVDDGYFYQEMPGDAYAFSDTSQFEGLNPSKQEYQAMNSQKQLKIKKKEKLSLLEKAFYLFVVLGILCFAALTIQMSAKVSEQNAEVVQIESTNRSLKEKITELKQQSQELSSADRVKKIAEKHGLSVNNDNFKKAK